MKIKSKAPEGRSDGVVYTEDLLKTGDVSLSPKHKDWSVFLDALEQVPESEAEGFLEDLARDRGAGLFTSLSTTTESEC